MATTYCQYMAMLPVDMALLLSENTTGPPVAVLATSAAAAAAAMVDCAVVPSAPVPASESVSRTAKVFGEVSLRTSLPTQKVRAL